MPSLTVKNRSSKISPGGIVTLPLSARKALRMTPGEGARVTIATDGESVTLEPTTDQAGARVSPHGQMEVVGKAKSVLEQGAARHYWLELDDEQQRVTLHPYSA